MSEPTEPMTRMQILECADDIRKKFNQNGGIISRYGLDFLLDTLETLLDPSQPVANEESETFDPTEFCVWADRTFPKSIPRSIATHLQREVVELLGAIPVDKPGNGEAIAGEVADCYLLLSHLAHKLRVDLNECARDKFSVLKTRQWGEIDSEGVVEHVRETTEESAQDAADPAPLDNAETLPGQSWADPRVTPDAAPDDLVERTRFWVEMCKRELAHPTDNTYFLGFRDILSEWLDRANLRPTREEALAEEKQKILNDYREEVRGWVEFSESRVKSFEARIAELLTENTRLRAKVEQGYADEQELSGYWSEELVDHAKCEEKLRAEIAELRAKIERGETVRVIPEDRRIIPSFRLDEEEGEVSNPEPERVVWSEVMIMRHPFLLCLGPYDLSVQFYLIDGGFEKGQRYRVTVTEADDTPEEGRNG